MPGGLLAVHAHPDDETLSSGGALASWAAAGLPVTVVTCTRGERGEVIGEDLQFLLHDDDGFAAHRTGELHAAVAALGPGISQVFLDELPGAQITTTAEQSVRYVDSGMAWVGPGTAGPAADSGPDAFAKADLEEAAFRLATLIRQSAPDFVLSYDRQGGYGHPDHIKARAVAQRAVELVPGTRLLEIVRPWQAHQHMHAQLRAGLAELSGAELSGAKLSGAELGSAWLSARNLHLAGVSDIPAVVRAAVGQKWLVVDVKPVGAAVLEALRAHHTQIQHVQELPGQKWIVGCAALSNQEVSPVPALEFLQPVMGDFAGVSSEKLPPNVAWGDGNY